MVFGIMIFCIIICIIVIIVSALTTSKAYQYKHTIDPLPKDPRRHEDTKNDQ
ncbi:YtzI protein [Bacillus testis]|uniref:YtzI protein n=1 Tax=Bacillus testis TaxID=1622072 RepID=UPI0009E523C1|nr:YtzI protein [Bacillus testis]